MAESIGGQNLKEKVYLIHDGKKSNLQTNRWEHFSVDIKKDFDHPFMPWEDIDFLTVMVEIINNEENPVSVYIDNIRCVNQQGSIQI